MAPANVDLEVAPASDADERLRRERPRAFAVAPAIALFAIGVLARVAPMADSGGRLLRQFPTEDGYLMLTIARNIALGKGMSVSDGLQPTNGTQPLATLVWAVEFWLAGGDRRLGVLEILVTQLFISAAAALLLYRLARVLFGEIPRGREVALLVSAAWFASPLVVAHSMNCLETGLYALMVVSVLGCFVHTADDRAWSLRRCLGAGALLGLAFWARNDAIFLVGAACLLHVTWSLFGRKDQFARRLREAIVFGATSVLVASPWLAFNRLRFGAIVPVSGQSEALDAHFAENLANAPIAVFEYATLYLPIPSSLESVPWVVAIASLATALVAVLVIRVLRTAPPPARAIAGIGAIFGLCVLSFYGLSFGAGYFFSRYTFPLSPLLALLWAAVLRRAWELADARGWTVAPPVAAAAVLAFALGLDGRLYRNGSAHMHFQVVEWVRDHVPDSAWVAAPQSGTLGFFHDRTINLDGKVNPAALAVRRANGSVTRYVLEKREIEYLADWEGIASWATQPPIAAQFELVVDDPGRNLAVLRRREHAGS